MYNHGDDENFSFSFGFISFHSVLVSAPTAGLYRQDVMLRSDEDVNVVAATLINNILLYFAIQSHCRESLRLKIVWDVM